MNDPRGKKNEILRADYGYLPINFHLRPSLEDEESLFQVRVGMGVSLAAECDFAENDFHPV
jgi:hypothetical protein